MMHYLLPSNLRLTRIFARLPSCYTNFVKSKICFKILSGPHTILGPSVAPFTSYHERPATLLSHVEKLGIKVSLDDKILISSFMKISQLVKNWNGRMFTQHGVSTSLI